MKMKLIIAIFLLASLNTSVFAQEGFDPAKVDPEYTKVLVNRVDKFLKNLQLEHMTTYQRVRDIVVHQYQAINWLEEAKNKKVEALRKESGLEKSLMNAKIDLAKSQYEIDIFTLHTHFISQLNTELTPEQVDMIKDGMTYGVLERTYNGYLNLLPKLTAEQKRYIHSHLLTARELAMDKGSSDEKHATFGKYKGRINNYLSALGYDLKQAEMELKEREETKKAKN